MSNVLAKMNSAKPVEDRNPFPDAGPDAGPDRLGQATHEFAVLRYWVFDSENNGEAIGCDLLTLSSRSAVDGQPVHEPGTVVFNGFFVNRAPRYKGDNSESDKAGDFLAKLVGGTLADGQKAAYDALGDEGPDRVAKIAAQPLRGMRIKCTASRKRSKKSKNDDGTPKMYIEKVWSHVEQDAASIAAMRAQLDATHPLQERAPVAPVAPPPAYPPAPPYGAPVAPPLGYGYPPAPAYPPAAPQYPAPAPQPTAPQLPPLPPGWKYDGAGRPVPA